MAESLYPRPLSASLRTALADTPVVALPMRAVLDEVQRVPELLRALKLAVDRRRQPGRLILTGSANLLQLPNLGDSLAGRMEVLNLHPLSAAELARKPGRFLADLLEGRLHAELKPTATKPDVLVGYLLAGGFPEAVARTPVRARAWHRAYLQTLVERDARDVARLRNASALARLWDR